MPRWSALRTSPDPGRLQTVGTSTKKPHHGVVLGLRARLGRPPGEAGHVHELPGAVAIRVIETYVRGLKVPVFDRHQFRGTGDTHDPAAWGRDLLPFRRASHWIEIQP